MQIDLDRLPNDPAILQGMLRSIVGEQGVLHAENDKLRLLIRRLLRTQFGGRSEQLTPDQLQLGLEGLEQAVAAGEAAQDAAVRSDAQRQQRRAARSRRNHGALPAHLPRYDVVIDVEDKTCPCCSGALHLIGEDRAEQLDIVPAQLRVRVTRRLRYGCRACEGAVVRPSGQLRSRYKACRRDFSITSGTLFAWHKLPLWTYLLGVAAFFNEVKGKSMLAFSRELDVQYKTAFVLTHKLREAMTSSMKGPRIGGKGRMAEIDNA